MAPTKAPSELTRVRRLPERGAYDRAVIDAILDEALICHVGFAQGEQPLVIPTIHVRVGDTLFVHGSAASRMLEHGARGSRLCVTVTLVDGIVLARSAFHHSLNYRSVVLYGVPRPVTDRAEKLAVSDALVNRFAPGRAELTRRPSELELKATLMLALPIAECSAKIRTGGPKDDEPDLALPIWAGVVPVALQTLTPITVDSTMPNLVPPKLGLGLPPR